ncbi:MAG: hypothetical protein H0W18_14035 [Acidobacteria bacterium]|nr:hypothetical protein [Acidobacteriota bacterium]
MSRRISLSALCLVLLVSVSAGAQDPPAPPQAPPERADPDLGVDPLQPDFTLAALPTTLRMPRGKLAFRITHRFTRELGSGDFGDLVSDLFGIDGGAQIGLELRYGLLPGTQIGVHRTSDRTIQFFAQQSVLKQRDGAPLSLDGVAAYEGRENFREHRSGTFGLVVSRTLGRRAIVYLEPLFTANANPFLAGDDHAVMLGLGTRVRVRPALYLVGEYTPRIAGFDTNADQISFGVEMRAGGHLFQLNVSNGFGTTLGQLAGGGVQNDTWFFGFNLLRKFF